VQAAAVAAKQNITNCTSKNAKKQLHVFFFCAIIVSLF
jgi:hypothetical protein